MPEKMPEKELKKTTANGAPAVGKSRQKVRKSGSQKRLRRREPESLWNVHENGYWPRQVIGLE